MYPSLLKPQCFKPQDTAVHGKNNNYWSFTPSPSQGSRLRLNTQILPTPKELAAVLFLGQWRVLNTLTCTSIARRKIELLHEEQLTIITRCQFCTIPVLCSTSNYHQDYYHYNFTPDHCFQADMYRKKKSFKRLESVTNALDWKTISKKELLGLGHSSQSKIRVIYQTYFIGSSAN